MRRRRLLTPARCTPSAVATRLERKPYLLRISPDLRRDLEMLASADLRSVNAEIEFLLREAVRRRKHANHLASDALATDHRDVEE